MANNPARGLSRLIVLLPASSTTRPGAEVVECIQSAMQQACTAGQPNAHNCCSCLELLLQVKVAFALGCKFCGK